MGLEGLGSDGSSDLSWIRNNETRDTNRPSNDDDLNDIPMGPELGEDISTESVEGSGSGDAQSQVNLAVVQTESTLETARDFAIRASSGLDKDLIQIEVEELEGLQAELNGLKSEIPPVANPAVVVSDMQSAVDSSEPMVASNASQAPVNISQRGEPRQPVSAKALWYQSHQQKRDSSDPPFIPANGRGGEPLEGEIVDGPLPELNGAKELISQETILFQFEKMGEGLSLMVNTPEGHERVNQVRDLLGKIEARLYDWEHQGQAYQDYPLSKKFREESISRRASELLLGSPMSVRERQEYVNLALEEGLIDQSEIGTAGVNFANEVTRTAVALRYRRDLEEKTDIDPNLPSWNEPMVSRALFDYRELGLVRAELTGAFRRGFESLKLSRGGD